MSDMSHHPDDSQIPIEGEENSPPGLSNPLPNWDTPLANLVEDTPVADSPLSEGDAQPIEASISTRRKQPQADTQKASGALIPQADIPDIARPVRARSAPDELTHDQPQLIRQHQEGRLTLLPLAFGFIGAGVLLLANQFVDGLNIELATSLVIIMGALTLTYIFRFFSSGRRERGLFFVAMVLMLWGILVAIDVSSPSAYYLEDYWALFIAALGVAFIFTFIFERTHQIGLLFPAILIIYTSGLSILLTREIIPIEVQKVVLDYSPLVATFIGLSLLPTVIQKR
jgi:hypothetical protein